MNYRIAITPYLNNRPFVYHTVIENCELVQQSPRESVRALKEGYIQAGVIPVVCLSQLNDQFELLGNFGIASEGPVQSVLFLSQIPFEAFTSIHTIKLTSESMTSINLLGLLFGYQHGFDNLPRRARDQDEYEGELLIGDRALERLQGGKADYVMDLSAAWTRRQQLPFVFARWVVNKNASVKFCTDLKQWLKSFVNNEAGLQQAAAEREAQQFRMTSEYAMNYLQGIKTTIGEREREGQALFLAELQKYRPVFHDSAKQLRKRCA